MNTIKGITFNQWSKTAEAIKMYEVGRNIHRTIWKFPCGTTVIWNSCMPRNPFQRSWETVDCEWIVPMNEENKVLARKYHGYMEQAPYSEDGMGSFLFKGDNAMELAWEFVAEQRNNFIKND